MGLEYSTVSTPRWTAFYLQYCPMLGAECSVRLARYAAVNISSLKGHCRSPLATSRYIVVPDRVLSSLADTHAS